MDIITIVIFIYQGLPGPTGIEGPPGQKGDQVHEQSKSLLYCYTSRLIMLKDFICTCCKSFCKLRLGGNNDLPLLNNVHLITVSDFVSLCCYL